MTSLRKLHVEPLGKQHHCCYDTILILCRQTLISEKFCLSACQGHLMIQSRSVFPGIDHPNSSVTQERGSILHLDYTLRNTPTIK